MGGVEEEWGELFICHLVALVTIPEVGKHRVTVGCEFDDLGVIGPSGVGLGSGSGLVAHGLTNFGEEVALLLGGGQWSNPATPGSPGGESTALLRLRLALLRLRFPFPFPQLGKPLAFGSSASIGSGGCSEA